MYENIKKLDGNKCRVRGCGRTEGLEVHHIIPRSQIDSSDDPDNLITLCFIHHRLITMNKISDYNVLLELKYKADFRWYKSMAWHYNREQLRKVKNAK